MKTESLEPTLPIANTLLQRAFKENISVSSMKLQKLMYFLYKKYLKETGYALYDEDFEAWPYGPVLPSVYHEFKDYGADSICDYVSYADKSVPVVVDEDWQFYDALNFIWKKYSGYSAWYLSQLTHRDGTAWSKAEAENRLYLSDRDISEEGWEE